MVDHVRQQVRDAVKTTLRAASTRAGLEWYSARTRPIDAATANMPVGVIHTPTTRRVPMDIGVGTRTLEHRIDVVLEMFEQPDTADVADKLDTLCMEVENALDADPTLGAVVRDIDESEGFTTSVSITHEADQDIAVATLRFVAIVLTTEGAAGVQV